MPRKPKTPEERLAERYRRVFAHDPTPPTQCDSVAVFEDLMVKLCLYGSVIDERTKHLHNFAVGILLDMKIADDQNVGGLIRGLLNLPLPSPRDEVPPPGAKDVPRGQLGDYDA